jgi:hypothetical protein
MSLGRMIAEYAKQAPPGYLHVSEFARARKWNVQRVSAIAAKAPEAVRIANYIFVPADLDIRVSVHLNGAGKFVDRYYRGSKWCLKL